MAAILSLFAVFVAATSPKSQQNAKHVAAWLIFLPSQFLPVKGLGHHQSRTTKRHLVGQKHGWHLGRWTRGGNQTNAGPNEMPGFPRVRLARSMVGTWAVGHAEGIRQTLVRTRCQASHGFGWPEAWSVPGPLDTRRDLETRMSERDVLLTTGSVGQKPSRHLGLGNAGGLRPTPVRKICVASHGVGWPEAWSAPGPFETRRDLENARPK